MLISRFFFISLIFWIRWCWYLDFDRVDILILVMLIDIYFIRIFCFVSSKVDIALITISVELCFYHRNCDLYDFGKVFSPYKADIADISVLVRLISQTNVDILWRLCFIWCFHKEILWQTNSFLSALFILKIENRKGIAWKSRFLVKFIIILIMNINSFIFRLLPIYWFISWTELKRDEF